MSDQYEICSGILCQAVLHSDNELKLKKCGHCIARDTKNETIREENNFDNQMAISKFRGY